MKVAHQICEFIATIIIMMRMSCTHLYRKPKIVLDELPDHDYDFISVFQEANLKGTTGNPTAGDDASEVKFELTPCDAYGPVT